VDTGDATRTRGVLSSFAVSGPRGRHAARRDASDLPGGARGREQGSRRSGFGMDTRTPAPGITLVARFITRLELQKLIGAHTRFALLADCLVSGQIYLLMNLERAAVGASLIVGSEPGYAF